MNAIVDRLRRQLLDRGIDPPAADELLATVVDGLAWSGLPRQAERLAAGLLERCGDDARPRVLATVADAQLLCSKWTEALETSRLEARLGSGRGAAAAYAREALTLSFVSRLRSAAAAARTAVRLGRASGDDTGTCMGLVAESAVDVLRGRLRPCIERAREADAIAASTRDEALRARYSDAYPAHLLILSDRLDEGRRMVTDALDVRSATGVGWDLPILLRHEGVAHVYAGELDRARSVLDEAMRMHARVETGWGRLDVVGALAWVEVRRGNRSHAAALLDDARSRPEWTTSSQAHVWPVWAAALLLEEDDPRRAFTELDALWRDFSKNGVRQHLRAMTPDYVRLALACGRIDRAREAAVEAERAARLSPTPTTRLSAVHARGLVEDDPARFRRAVYGQHPAARPLALARLFEDAGHCYLRHGAARDGVRTLRQAFSTYELAGAAADAARVETHLSTSPHRATARIRLGSRPGTGWAAITPTEQHVVDLVCEGLTNAEIAARMFVSPRTVRTHLEKVFRKLGVRSRSELAAEATKRGRG